MAVKLLLLVVVASCCFGDDTFDVNGREDLSSKDVKTRIRRFERWLDRQELPINKAKMKPFPNMGIGLAATQSLQKGEIYLALPKESAMGFEAAMRSTIGPTLREINTEMNKNVGMTLKLFLIHERSLGKRSEWRTFIEALPRVLETPLYWTEEEYAAAEGCEIAAKGRHETTNMQASFLRMKNRVLEKYPHIFDPRVYDMEAFKWAHAIHGSRVINVQNFPGERAHFLPYIDMLNCKESDDKSYTGWSRELNAVVMRADEDYDEGDQIFETYGNKTNLEYLLYNGFVYVDNPMDCVEIKFTLPQNKLKNAALKAMGYKDSWIDCVRGDRLLITSKVMMLARVAVSPPEDFPVDLRTHVFSKEIRKKGNRYLRRLFQRKLEAYPTSVAEDEALLAAHETGGSVLTPNMRNIVLYRLEEKKTLRRLIERKRKPAQ